MSLPERFDLSYIGKSNERLRPVMIHRVIYGSIERFLGILVEHFAGKFPLWMAPTQAVVLPINDELMPHANDVKTRLEAAGLRVDLDDRTESLNKKIRDAQVGQIPLIITIGPKERDSNTLSVRTLDGKVRYGMQPEELLNRVLEHIRTRKPDLNIFEG
jgi:threonyl-tRNA synthetase